MPFVDTSLLRVGYEDLNPQGRHAVVLVHGWPDSPRTWLQVAPLLSEGGVPCHRAGAPGVCAHHFLAGRDTTHRATGLFRA